jgi:flagellar hook-associated protein 1 FlgK
MATINSAMGLISGALDADQEALDTVANNVANANTAGYTREVSNWKENDSVTIGGISRGEGVTNTGATSVRDRVLSARLDQQQQLASASSARLTALQSIESLFTPDSGSSSSASAGDIGSALTGFFNTFSSLEADPTNASLRQDVLSKATTLAADISGAAGSLAGQKADLDQEAAGVTAQVNSLTSAIAQLNQQIQSDSPNTDAGALEDQRQLDISQLSKLIGVNQVTTENNGLSITTTSGAVLVSEGTNFQITNGMVGGETHFFLGAADMTAELTGGGGELGGDLTARDQDIPAVASALDQLAYSVSTQVNALNNSGTDLEGNTGTAANPLYIFSEPAQVAGSAQAMSVVMTDPSEITAAALGQGTGDSSNAAALAGLANSLIVSDQSPSNFFSGMVAALGATVDDVQAENTAENASVSQLQTQSDALSSVNLNDEASSLSTLERSYQAAAQMFTILNTVMASALNLGDQTTVA